VERSQEDFNTISIVIKKELEQFELARVKEFKKIIVKYLESLYHHQQEVKSSYPIHNIRTPNCTLTN